MAALLVLGNEIEPEVVTEAAHVDEAAPPHGIER